MGAVVFGFKSLILALALGLSACASTENTEARLNYWLGAPSDNLVKAWGAPTSVYDLNEGGRVLTYRREYLRHVRGVDPYLYGSYHRRHAGYYGHFWPDTIYQTHCQIDFTEDTQGLIVEWNYQGTSCAS